MPITGRPARWVDIEPGLSIQPKVRGDALVGPQAAVDAWRKLVQDPFFASAVLEASPPIAGHRLIGFGASVIVTSAFADAEVAKPRPDIAARIIESVCSGHSVLATRNEVARANAGAGVTVMVLSGAWRDAILNPTERYDVQTVLATGFTEWHAGYRIHRIFHETPDEPTREFVHRSVVYQPIAEFPDLGRATYLMTAESVKAVPASLGNILFSYREPVLRLRESEQQLLLSALGAATDLELTAELGVTLAAVKARWRSTFARIAETMPGLVAEVDNQGARGMQKRHRVLAYVRSHPEELRPFDWNTKARTDRLNVSKAF